MTPRHNARGHPRAPEAERWRWGPGIRFTGSGVVLAATVMASAVSDLRAQSCDPGMSLTEVTNNASAFVHEKNDVLTAIRTCYRKFRDKAADSTSTSLGDLQIEERFLFEYEDSLHRLAEKQTANDTKRKVLDEAVAISQQYLQWWVRRAKSEETAASMQSGVMRRTDHITKVLGETYEKLAALESDPRPRNEVFRRMFEAFANLRDTAPTLFGYEAVKLWRRELSDYVRVVLGDSPGTPPSLRTACAHDFEYSEWWEGLKSLLQELQTSGSEAQRERMRRLYEDVQNQFNAG